MSDEPKRGHPYRDPAKAIEDLSRPDPGPLGPRRELLLTIQYALDHGDLASALHRQHRGWLADQLKLMAQTIEGVRDITIPVRKGLQWAAALIVSGTTISRILRPPFDRHASWLLAIAIVLALMSEYAARWERLASQMETVAERLRRFCEVMDAAGGERTGVRVDAHTERAHPEEEVAGAAAADDHTRRGNQ